ncbi:methyl-accepting chemotaxis protein [Pseudooceanicola onchidii]|uniref:methyl-accepting chemotaxis protein n=1 Tax=Pseudooceanicola onchidii TaxID=2562279 RepID=UPI0010AAA6F4|nr:methyl-accepting chemotaxis protein [Pseudooceanicola onchidii]
MHHDQTGFDAKRHAETLNRVAENSAALGAEIVDVNGFLDELEAQSGEQLRTLKKLRDGAGHVVQVNASVMETLTSMSEAITATLNQLNGAYDLVSDTQSQAGKLVSWIESIDRRSQDVQGTLDAVQTSNNQIAVIAAQVNMLAINAKIEAARAGETGKGFAVVADAINELSHRTGKAAEDITDHVSALIDWITELQSEAGTINAQGTQMFASGTKSQTALAEGLEQMKTAHHRTELITRDAEAADTELRDFLPRISAIDSSVQSGAEGVRVAHDRVSRLVDTSERMVQDSVALGGAHDDSPFIREVTRRAAAVREAFEDAVRSGQLTMDDLFDTAYRPVPGSDPVQVITRFTRFTDHVLPEIQEPALDFDPRVVFCAAVDRNGYLPTHNLKFSHPQGDDPVWNAANSRNRRVFDDRVGFKAGQNTDPFLLQVYRRDMGGGTFAMMKDLSAPIFVEGRHWGGLRLAYHL